MELILVTEAEARTGLGHYEETIALAEEFRSRGLCKLEIAISEDVASDLLTRAPVSVRRVILDDRGCRSLGATVEPIEKKGIIVNLRSVAAAQLKALASSGAVVLCIDETGRDLPCHVLVNPTWTRIQRQASGCEMAMEGPQYLSLAEGYRRRHQQARSFEGPLRSLVASFGGSDLSRTSLRVIAALAGWRPEVAKALVLGPSFDSRDAVLEAIEESGDRSWTVHSSPGSLVGLLGDADVALTAGGNTLAEIACLGTPGIVIHEDPHEGEAGRAFESRGFGRSLCQAAELTPTALRQALSLLDDPAERKRQALAGKTLVDGRGAGRIVDIMTGLLQ